MGSPLIKPAAGDVTPPELLAAVSRRMHGGSGTFDIPLPLSGTAGCESRTGGPTQLALSFSEPVAAIDATLDCSEVGLSSGACSAVTPAGNDLIVDLTGAAPNACLTVTLSGLEDAAGNDLTGDTDVSIRVQRGNRDSSDTVVNIVDLNAVKQNLFNPLDAGNFRSDINADGVVNIVDLNETKQSLFSNVSCP